MVQRCANTANKRWIDTTILVSCGIFELQATLAGASSQISSFIMTENEPIPENQNRSPEVVNDETIEKEESKSPKQTETPNAQTENMEVHHHPDLHHKQKKWKEYLLEFVMIFLAVTMGFFAEQIRERHVEKERLHNYFESMTLDIESNITVLDSAINENSKMTLKYDSIVKQFISKGDTINRKDFAKHMGAVWYRGFTNHNETFEQMKYSGSLRYIDDFKLLTAIMQYVRATNFAQYRTEHFEEKYYTELFLPTFYKSYDLPCKFFLDTAYTNDHTFINTLDNHIDILTGKDAEVFKQDVGGALLLRLERMRVSVTAYKIAKKQCISLKELIKQHQDD